MWAHWFACAFYGLLGGASVALAWLAARLAYLSCAGGTAALFWGDGYEGLKLAMFEAKIRYEGLVFRFWRPQNLKEHTWFWVR